MRVGREASSDLFGGGDGFLNVEEPTAGVARVHGFTAG